MEPVPNATLKGKQIIMKKLIVIIIVLVIIFVGMIIYKDTAVVGKNSITIEEINKIENYINKIYMWKEVTNEALPTFENINNADDLWTWEVVKKNLEEYELTYEQINEKAKELFGDNFEKQFPKEGTEGTEGIMYDENKNKYYPSETNLDGQEDTFLLNNIEKKEGKYIVEIVEYLEDYSSQTSISIINLQGEEIGKVGSSDSETKIQEAVKQNIDRFSKKKIYLKVENENLVVDKVE